MPSDASSKQFTIREEKGKFCLYSKSTGKRLGCHPTKEEALAQERAIQARKNMSLSREEMAELCDDCAEQMEALGLREVVLTEFEDDAFAKIVASAYHKQAAMPAALKKGLVKRIGKTKEGFRTRCMKLVADNVTDSGAFCNWLKGQVFGSEQFFDQENDDQSPSRTYLNAYMKHLREALSDRVPMDVFKDAMKRARAKAGGKMSARKRKRRMESAEACTAGDACPMKEGMDQCPEGDSCPMHKAYAEFYDMGYGPKLAKDDKTVSFSLGGGKPGKRCGECRFFMPASCNLVEGTIEGGDVCSLYRERLDYSFDEPEELYAICASEELEGQRSRGEWALFVPFSMAEAGEKEWIPYLPVPGEYEHPRYGIIVITPERNQHFVENFRNGVYQKSIPIDAEHDIKVSGALGYVEDLRVNKDGSVDAQVRWTDRGAEMVEADRFRYVSPEWYDEWTDPMSGQKHSDVLIGGALTTRPFFKEKALRPLVAAEQELDAWLGEGLEPVRFARRKKEDSNMATKDEKKTKSFKDKLMEFFGADAKEDEIRAELKSFIGSEDSDDEPDEPKEKQAGESKTPKSLAERLAATESRLHAAEERAELAEAREKEATQRLTSLEREAQRKRFTDLVKGRTDKSPNRWFGDVTKNVETLIAYAAKLGETSDEFKALVDREIAHANQMHAVSFDERGSSFGALGDEDVESRVETEAKKLHENAPDTFRTIEQARVEVWKRHPDWKKEYREKQSRR